MGSPFCAGETVDGLMLKLLHNKLKINRAKDLMMQLQNLVDHISEDINRIENQLRPRLQRTMSASSVYPESFLLLPSAANLGITESIYFSHISSPGDSFMDCDSSLEFSNVNNVVDTRNNGGFVNEQWVQPGLVYPAMPESDRASEAFQNILPEKGNLLRSVIDAGAVLQMLPVAGPLPLWRHPPPQGSQPINFAPPLTIKDLDVADMGDCADLQGDSFSDSMLNFAGVPSDPWIHDQVPGSKRHRLY
ncbi:uncharacterized protein LOC129314800 isoform X2 [Prosopis cineraria]|uniref:uncharacterized protein LOC129314800 isoform X2 n=1 Tax=Prosopis cineraria TaxID=364024 RepID=UPI00240F6004|nr:uncharacterized protein LOC129314800 isoform X2 [Prosopis cineraria]